MFHKMVARVSGDGIFAYRNNLQYLEFVSEFSKDDYFVKDQEVSFTKISLKEMLKNDVICNVDRDYGEEKGFNRLK